MNADTLMALLSGVCQAFDEGLGSYTKEGTWAIDEIEAAEIEEEVDEDEEFEQYLRDHAEWTKPPLQPAGIDDGARPLPS